MVRVGLGQSSSQVRRDDQPGSLRGTVVNAVTGTPIARALVFTPGNRFATLTDGEGHFEFALPKPAGDGQRGFIQNQGYTFSPSAVLARKPGFLDDPNGRAQVDANSTGEISIPLLPEAVIKGRVILSETDPSLGITVRIFSRVVPEGVPQWMQTGATRANSNGEFRFAELLPGTYKLVTNEAMDNDPATTVPGGPQFGFPPVYFPGVADFAAAGTIQITAGQTVQSDIPLTRQPYFPVRIPVANAELNPNLNVTVSLTGHHDSIYSLGYNAEEKRIEGLLPNGKYLVEAEAPGENSATGAVHLAVAGAPAEGPSLTLIPNSSIPVHVTEQFTSNDPNNISMWNVSGRSFQVHGPRRYLQISAQSAEDFGRHGAALRPPTGPNDETLLLENLPPGRYRLSPHSSRGYVAAATMGGIDLLHEPFVVASGSSATIEITMRDDTAELDATVAGITRPAMPESALSFPSQPAWVYCIPLSDSPGQFQQFWVSPDGKINPAALPPGTYRLMAFKTQQPNLPYRDAEAMRAYETKGQVVHLPAGQKTSVQLQIISSTE
jgi:hypothetical protein